MKYGLKTGLIFFGISILMGVTFAAPVAIGGALETIAMLISPSEIGITSFYISLLGLFIPTAIYIFGVITKSVLLDKQLIFLFLLYLVFLNTTLFYKDFLEPNFQMDGQQAFLLMFMPIKTSWVYPLIGFIHDKIKDSEYLNNRV